MPFTQEGLDFLVENRLRDSREWFRENKPRYQELVVKPMAELVEALAPAMLKIDPGFITEPRVDRTISRIYRDVRFSHDKAIFRENIWLCFMREKKLYMGLPAYYFEITPSGFSYGMGYYQASPQSVQAIRTMIMGDEPAYKAAYKAYKGQSTFTLHGDLYKKTRHPDQPEEKRDWLDRKSLSFNAESDDFTLLFSDKLAHTLEDGFKKLAPVYHFLVAAESRKDAL